MRLTRRVDELDQRHGHRFRGPAACIVPLPGETSEQAIARHELEHGPLLVGQPVLMCWTEH